MAIVKDALVFNTFTKEHVQSLSNLFKILHADLGMEVQQESECVTSCQV